MSWRHLFVTIAVALALPVSFNAQVTPDRLLRAADEPQNWLTYSGGYASQRYSTLSQITRDNVGNLELAWLLPMGAPLRK